MSRESIIQRSVISYLEERGIKIPSLSILLPALGMVVSEWSMYYGRLEYALWGHSLTLLFCLFIPIVSTSDTGSLQDVDLFAVFALVPLFRLVNLGMPIFIELTLAWFPLVYAPIVPAIYLVASDDQTVDISYNPRAVALLAIPSIPIAIVLAEFEYAIITPEALIPVWSLSNLLLIGVVMFGFVGFVEELLFRGVFQRALQHRLGQWEGLLLASGLFGLMHSAYGTGWEVLFAAVIGFVFGVIYDWTDSLLLVTFLHGLLNVFLFGIIPLQGSLIGIGG